MKASLLILFGFLSHFTFAQTKVDGHYRDYLGSYLQLNPDSTFYYYFHFDLRASWSKGTWRFQKDTIDLFIHPVYDTISVKHNINSQTMSDSLVLSVDENADRRLEAEDFVVNNSVQVQNGVLFPQKLFYLKGRLYEVKEGRILKWIDKGTGKRKRANWFYKS
jgi:hypothetical protein